MRRVRIKYWRQDTIESGYWQVSGTMLVKTAKKLIESDVYESPRIVADEEGWPELPQGVSDEQ